MNDSQSPRKTHCDLWVLGFFIALCLALGTGRLGNGDTPGMIDSGVQMYENGSFSAPAPIGTAPDAWVAAPDGRYFESHDLGGQVLGFLAVAAAHQLDPNASTYDFSNPTTRWCAVILNNLLAAFTLWMVYKSCRILSSARMAVGMTLALLFCTFFVWYCRSVFDVTGAALGVSIAVYGSIRLLTAEWTIESGDFGWWLVAIGMGVAVFFRYSIAPLAVLTMLMLILVMLRRSSFSNALLVLIVFGACLIPMLGYNYVRTGNPINPPNRMADFAFNRLRYDGPSIAKGLGGLTFGPNSGMFVFAPWLLAMVLIPLRWKRLSLGGRRFVLAWTPGLLAYVVLISMLTAWGGPGGWGPRYLVVILPAVVLITAVAILATGKKSAFGRFVFFVLILLGLLVNLPVAVENYRTVSYDAPFDQAQGVRWPATQAAAWRGIQLEVLGPGISRPAWQKRIDSGLSDQTETAGSSVFPDLPFILRGTKAAKPYKIAVWSTLGIGALCGLMTLRLLRKEANS